MLQLTDAGKFNLDCPDAGACHSGNLGRAVVVASTAPFGPSALMLNWWTRPGGGDGPVNPDEKAPHGTAGCPR